MGINEKHEYTFTVSGSTTTQALKTALDRAEQAVGQNNQLFFSYYAGDQREPSMLTVKVSPGRGR